MTSPRPPWHSEKQGGLRRGPQHHQTSERSGAPGRSAPTPGATAFIWPNARRAVDVPRWWAVPPSGSAQPAAHAHWASSRDGGGARPLHAPRKMSSPNFRYAIIPLAARFYPSAATASTSRGSAGAGRKPLKPRTSRGMGKRGHTKVSQGIGDPDLRVGVMVQTPSGIQPVLAQLSARYGSTLCFLRL